MKCADLHRKIKFLAKLQELGLGVLGKVPKTLFVRNCMIYVDLYRKDVSNPQSHGVGCRSNAKNFFLLGIVRNVQICTKESFF